MFKIKIADVVIEIDNRDSYIKDYSEDYIVSNDEPAAFTVRATDEEIQKEFGDCKCDFIGYAECLCLFRHICMGLINHNGFVMHCAVVEIDNNAYAFAANSGTGKSTHIKLWLKEFKDKCKVVNGDKPIMRLIDDKFYACGNPWQGKEQMGNPVIVPLKAVCFLERAKENSIRKLDEGEVISRIFHQLIMPSDEEKMVKFMSLIDEMLSKVNFYLLSCNMDPEAAHVAFDTMRGE